MAEKVTAGSLLKDLQSQINAARGEGKQPSRVELGPDERNLMTPYLTMTDCDRLWGIRVEVSEEPGLRLVASGD